MSDHNFTLAWQKVEPIGDPWVVKMVWRKFTKADARKMRRFINKVAIGASGGRPTLSWPAKAKR